MVAKIAAAPRLLNAATGSVMLPLTQSHGPDFGTWRSGPIEIPLGATNGTGSYTWSVIGSLPPGISLRTDVPSWFGSASAGLIGVATTPGTYNFTLSVTSGVETVPQNCTLRVTGLTITESQLPDAFAGVPYSYSLTAVGSANASAATFTTAGSVPAGMTLATNGTLSGSATTPGFYNVSFRLGDGTDVVNLVWIGIYVSAIEITTAGTTPGVLPNVIQDVPYTASVSASPAGSYTFSANGLPFGLTMSDLGGISGTVISNNGSNPGPFSVSVTATNNSNHAVSETRTMSIDVLGAAATLPAIAP
jgi:hypothetical protein